MAKKGVLIISISIIAVLLILGFLAFYFIRPTANASVQGSQQGNYPCPNGYTCTAALTLQCNDLKSDTKVVFRQTADQSTIGTSAIYLSMGGTSLEKHTLASTGSKIPSGTLLSFNAPGNYKYIYKESNGIFIYSGTGQSSYRRYSGSASSCDGNSCSISPLEPFKSGGLETYSGSLYSCSRNIYISDNFQSTLSWDGITPKNITSSTYTMSGGQTMTSTGTGAFIISYTQTTIPNIKCTSSSGISMNIGNKICPNNDRTKQEICNLSNGNAQLIQNTIYPPQYCSNGEIYTEGAVVLTNCTDIYGNVLNTGVSKCVPSSPSQTIETCIAQNNANPKLVIKNLIAPTSCVNGQEVTQTKSTCTDSSGNIINIGKSFCPDPGTLETCSPQLNQDPKIITTYAPQGQVCRDGGFTNPYTVTVTFDKTILASTDTLEVDVAITDTPNNIGKTIKAAIYQNGQLKSQLQDQLTGNAYPNTGKTHFSVDAPTVGYYTLRISFSDPDKPYSQDFPFTVTDSLGISLDTINPTQFNNAPITFKLSSSKQGSPINLFHYDVKIQYEGSLINDCQVSPSNGILSFSINQKYLPDEGDVLISARGSLKDVNGVETWYPSSTSYTEPLTIHIKKAYIQITPKDIAADVCVGTYTDTFETRDSTGNLISTINTIQINKPLTNTPDTLTVNCPTGQCSFSHNFGPDGGSYTIRITSTNDKLGSSMLNSGQGIGVRFLSGASCNNPTCQQDGTCPIDYTWYIIGGIVAVALIIFFWFILRKKKKR